MQDKMANNPPPNRAIPVIAMIVGVIAIFVTVAGFAYLFSPSAAEPSPTVTPPNASPLGLPSPYQPESLPLPSPAPAPTRTATVPPASPSRITHTPFVSPTMEAENLPLPDLTVTGISDPVCVPDRPGTIIEFSIFVRNIGRTSTRSFGSFDTGLYLLLGQRRYGLDEWATQFNGVVGSSLTEVVNLGPDADIKFTVVIDLKGNKDFGIEVIANSGESPIREADMTNNTLIKYSSVSCY